MKSNLIKFLLIVLCAWVASIGAFGQTQIIYVKKGGTGTGSSWATAYGDLQGALVAATSISGNKEIWVARGEWRPATTVNRTASFVLPANTKIYGGFIGNEASASLRNWRTNRTVLSGDLGILLDNSDNVYHVVTAKNLDANTLMDGFIISFGNANADSVAYGDAGGGMLVVSESAATSIRIENCEFSRNNALVNGGGMALMSNNNFSNTTVVANCYFNGNTSAFGAGAANVKLSGTLDPRYVNCSFSLNRANTFGGAMANLGSAGKIVNCSMSKNSAAQSGGAIYNANSSAVTIANSIIWNNFKNDLEDSYSQIYNAVATATASTNIIKGGYGKTIDQNRNIDPLFVREPVVTPSIPQVTIIPVTKTDLKYQNIMQMSGSKMGGSGTYSVYKDHSYNKIYLSGAQFQIIDLNNLTSGLPTSTIHIISGTPSAGSLPWGRTQHLARAVSDLTNKIYFGSYYSGLVSIDRADGSVTAMNVLQGEPITVGFTIAQDVAIDAVNNMLYAPIFYSPNGVRLNEKFYGILELNLATNAKRWITNTSSPVAVPTVNNAGDDAYWNGHRVYLDEIADVLYYSMGYGVWWWNRTTNETGVYSTTGGMPLTNASPKLPSNLTTGLYIDQGQNKFYIGTYAGLFVWDRNNNTSKVYNKSNSLLPDNMVLHIDKAEGHNLIYVACGPGGVLVINTLTGEQKVLKKDVGHEIDPQPVDTFTGSVYFDKVENSMYTCTIAPSGGVYVKHFSNLVSDFGDLSVQDDSPALDKSSEAKYDATIVKDIVGKSRFVDFASVNGGVSLDQGAYEKQSICPDLGLNFSYTQNYTTFTLRPSSIGVIKKGPLPCTKSYLWDFGDGATSTDQIATHTYMAKGNYTIKLTMTYSCDNCEEKQVTVSKLFAVSNYCDNIHCDGAGNVAFGGPTFAAGYRLSVAGRMWADEIKVAFRSKWPDYVFEKDYKLLPLTDLRKYLDENHHLPNVPTAAEVKDSGIDAGDMGARLTEKIEELSLYFIQLDERLKRLEEKEK